ncbi:MAG: FliM/FliN family flagellar motor C-terminal domain-containing protein [Bryobacteraceae bacterium]
MPELSAIDGFGRLPVTVEVRVGGLDLTLDELLQLEVGSVIPLDRPAGETLEVRVGNVPLASAEVVAIEDRLAVRITDFEPGVSIAPPESETAE